MALQHPTALFDVHVPRSAGQLTLQDLGTPLADVTFVVVDLETTGSTDITEIGAVKTRGGEVIGEFATLVRPENSVISPFVERLTGITNGMVAQAPSLSAVLPSFLEFSRGAVLVAHNAGFDIGFLRSACESLDYTWPDPPVLDTVKLSRQVVPRGEVANHKLSTLAAHFGTAVEPNHRALADARATSEILHHVFDRFGSFGITTLEELSRLKPAGWQKRRTKVHLAKDVPAVPGVYMFLDGSRRVLYVGVSANMRTRVRNYFTAGETRGRMAEMITAAQEVSAIPCDTVVEARIREVRLIAELAPPYNRRSKHPERRTWVRLTDEPFARLSLTRSDPGPDAGNGRRLGPFRSHRAAAEVKLLLERLYPLKQCTQKTGSSRFTPCVSGELGRCGGPCSGDWDGEAYLAALTGVTDLLHGLPSDVLGRCRERMTELTVDQRYEEAAGVRDAMMALFGAQASAEKRAALARVEELVAAAPRSTGGWEIAVIRWGRLAGSCAVAADVNPYPAIEALCRTAEFVERPSPGLTAALDEETGLLHAWLGDGSTRLVRTSDSLCEPRLGHAQALGSLSSVRRAPAV
ncbi:DEDD exonuclease domain-containing protein [Brevibacterium daeguense]|uniref:DEDD exonuclease domain-containing protein n=1 Tax=Brevibacterium daeguense TaxID=909936 RepID=A0ABP8ENU5_9MICO|nr:DEDD exonuclease domain-containing protein [Brevibacterium daeguense]